MFNFHVGLPGVASELLHSCAQVDEVKSNRFFSIVPQRTWRNNFRGFLSSDGGVNSGAGGGDIIEDLSRFGSVAISQHAILGVQKDCFLGEVVLPKSETKIARVSELFKDFPLTFHLTIVSQFEYLISSLGRGGVGNPLLDSKSVPSWANLVKRLSLAVPNRHIVVWDFESPKKISLDFLLRMIGTKDEFVFGALSDHLDSAFPSTQGIIDVSQYPSYTDEYIYLLDRQYDLDLDAISKIENVSLMRSDSATGELPMPSKD